MVKWGHFGQRKQPGLCEDMVGVTGRFRKEQWLLDAAREESMSQTRVESLDLIHRPTYSLKQIALEA